MKLGNSFLQWIGRLGTSVVLAVGMLSGVATSVHAATGSVVLSIAPGNPLTSLTNAGTLSYVASSGRFTANLVPNTTIYPPENYIFPVGSPATRYVKLDFFLTSTGEVAGGVAGDDLVFYGGADVNGDWVPDYSGVLLTGEIVRFGHQDSGGLIDRFDMRFRVTGGALAAYFAGKDIGVVLNPENSSFVGIFTSNFAATFVKGVMGPIPTICVDLRKEVSVDGGVTWHDANSAGDADVPSVNAPAGGQYRLIVTNCGGRDLVNLQLDDPTLGVSYTLAGLPSNLSVTIGSGTIPALSVPGLCTHSNTIFNAASVVAKSATTNELVSDADTAVVVCVGQPAIGIAKQISVDGGVNWFDADTAAAAPMVNFPHGADYRFVVTNTGSANLTNVVVNDATLGVTHTIGSLAVGQQVTLDSGTIPAVSVATRCANAGEFINHASVSGNSVDNGTQVTATDPAVLVCIGTPGITISKQISIDGSVWADADNIGDADVPQAIFPSDAQYRFIVTNTGSVDLASVRIDDAALGVVGYNVGSLAIGQSVTIAQGSLPALYVANRCTNAGMFTNSVNVSAASAANATQTVNASDTAVLECVGQPGVQIIKEISTNGIDWFDANTVATAPSEAFPSGAQYRFTVSNVGTAPLTNVVVNDGDLGISNYMVGDLAVGASVTIGSGQIAQLEVATRCDMSGTFTNVVSVDAQSMETGEGTSYSDSAILVCYGTPNVSLRKQISVDGGTNWADADNAGDADVPSVLFPHDAEYRLIVTNTGNIDLTNVVVNDADLGIVNQTITGVIAVGAEVIVGSGDIPALMVVDRCTGSGTIANVAQVSADAVDTGTTVTASNPALMTCIGTPSIELRKQVSLDGNNWADADTAGDVDVPHALAPSDAEYRFVVRNNGTTALSNVIVNDATLGISGYVVGDLAIGEQVTIESGDLPALLVVDRCTNAGTFVNVADVSGDSTETGQTVSDSNPAVLVCSEPPTGECLISLGMTATYGDTTGGGGDVGDGQGCTPGYWKQSQHFVDWTSPYTPSTQFGSVFADAFPGKTLLQVLGEGGGGLDALGRHVVAALLNSASSSVGYGMTPAEVVAEFNAAYAGGDAGVIEALKDELAGMNERGCPLSGGHTGGGDTGGSSSCTNVVFTYVVTNEGAAVNALLEDDTFDLGLAPFVLAESSAQTFTNEVCISENTTNTATVTASVVGNGAEVCSATSNLTTYCRQEEVWVQHCTNSSSGGQECSLVKEVQTVCDDTPPPECTTEEVWVQHCTNSSSGGQECSLVKEVVVTCPGDEPPPPVCHEEDQWVQHCTNSSSGGQECSLVNEPKTVCEGDEPPPPVCHEEDEWVQHCTNSSSGGQECSMVNEPKTVCEGDEPPPPVCHDEEQWVQQCTASSSGGQECSMVKEIKTVCEGDEPPPPAPVACGTCDGKVDSLNLRYNGTTTANVVVTQKDGTSVFSGSVGPGAAFSFVGTDKKATLGTEITITVNGGVDTRIHTSCSQEINIGMNFGSFTVLGGTSRNGGAFCALP